MPLGFTGTVLSFQAMRDMIPLHGQEDFSYELRTCRNDAELVLAIAKRIEREMALTPIIRGIVPGEERR
jgi:hypothetical protein